MASKVGYRITVRGQYYASGDRGTKVIRNYEPQTFLLPEIVTYVAGRKSVETQVGDRLVKTSVPDVQRCNGLRIAQHFIRRYYIEPALREQYDKYPDFSGVRTMEIVLKEKVKTSSKDFKEILKIPIAEMNEPQLRQFHAIQDLKCVIEMYGGLADQRIAIEAEYKQKLADERSAKRAEKPESSLLTEPENEHVVHPESISESDGAVTSADGIPIDEQDRAAALLG